MRDQTERAQQLTEPQPVQTCTHVQFIVPRSELSDTLSILIACFMKSGDLELFSDEKPRIMSNCHHLQLMVEGKGGEL